MYFFYENQSVSDFHFCEFCSVFSNTLAGEIICGPQKFIFFILPRFAVYSSTRFKILALKFSETKPITIKNIVIGGSHLIFLSP
jgi:hypothetical protein